MRRSVAFLLSLIMIWGLGGCSTEAPEQRPRFYDIIQEEGQWYLVPNSEMEPYRTILPGVLVNGTPGLEFSSVEEMKTDIETGSFTEEELDILADFRSDDQGRIPIMDLSALEEPVYPAQFDKMKVWWRDQHYSIHLSSEKGGLGVTMAVYSREPYEEFLQERDRFPETIGDRMQSVTKEEDRQATVYTFMDLRGALCKRVYYTFGTEDKLMHVCEHYDPDASETVPTFISLYAKEHDRYFFLEMHRLDQRPSIDLLWQFGMRPCQQE